MTVKELCEVTTSEFCIVVKEKVKYWGSKTSLGKENQIPADLLNREIDSINIELDPWDIAYLEIFLKNS